MSGEKFIAWLSNLHKSDISLAGEKAANLGEMFNAKFPVPQAFVITTTAFSFFLKQSKLEQPIKDILNKIRIDDTDDLQEKSQEIRTLITNAKMPPVLESEILEAYDNFSVDLSGIGAPGALAILRTAREPIFVSVRSSNLSENLNGDASAEQQSSFINIKGNQELLQKIKECFASTFKAQSIYYRKKKGLDDLVEIATIVQKMINSNKSGVMFSKNPLENKDEIIIEAIFGQSEGIISKTINPDQYTLSKNFEILKEQIADKKLAIVRTASGQTKTVTLTPEKSTEKVLKTHELKQLAEYALKLEQHYKTPQEIEFSIEDNTIYILQTKPITILKEKSSEPKIEFTKKAITQKISPSTEILPIVPTKTQIKVIIDLPQFASQAAKTKAHGIGLVKLEELIATSRKHPLFYEKENKLEDYKKILKKELEEIADIFIGKPIWVRTSDIRNDEYSNLIGAPKESEKNPMLGNHGIRFSLKHPKILKTELQAIKELADKGHKFGVIFPQIISIEEVKQAKTIFEELKMENVAFGIMIETPAAAILIKDICEIGIDFISFETSNLTQYTLAIDKENKDAQNLYEETCWAVLKQISRVIRECKKQGVETSICGQATSNPKMIEFLIKCGIDSISLNAEAAYEVSKLIQKLEINSAIEPINNKEEIKKELKEFQEEEEISKQNSLNPEPIEEIENIKEE